MATACIAAALLCAPADAAAAPGALDRTFSADGRRVLRFPDASTLQVEEVAVQRDHRIVVVGTVFTPPALSAGAVFVLRLRRDGRRDRSFGGDGVRRISATPEGDWGTLSAR